MKPEKLSIVELLILSGVLVLMFKPSFSHDKLQEAIAEAMPDQIQLTGQKITSGAGTPQPIETVRFVDESVDDWLERHKDALEHAEGL